MYVSNKSGTLARIVPFVLIAFSLLFVTADLKAQSSEITVKGRVTDTQGEPLIAVNVLVKGTQQVVTTDFDGNYQIMAPANATLEPCQIKFLMSQH